jgi:hypothetical protein
LPSDHQLLTDVLFKLPALDQLFYPNEQDEGAVGRSQHTVDLVDADVVYPVAPVDSGAWRYAAQDGLLQSIKRSS